ncbi:hypothetical protein AAE478_007949 [Parahypoxylon ruwenzoriense]
MSRYDISRGEILDLELVRREVNQVRDKRVKDLQHDCLRGGTSVLHVFAEYDRALRITRMRVFGGFSTYVGRGVAVSGPDDAVKHVYPIRSIFLGH